MKRMLKRLASVYVAASAYLLVLGHAFGAGVTIITHGYSLNATNPQEWINDYANTIATRSAAPSSVAVYEITISQQALGPGNVQNEITSISLLSGSADVFSQSANAEIIFKVNWSDCATQIADGLAVSSTTIAKLLADYFITTRVSTHAWIEQPIHLIGHSRGASVCSELARLLGENGVWVEQQTTLDPHPVNNDGNIDSPFWVNPTFSDASVKVYKNTVFADNYWENTIVASIGGITPTYPAGHAVTGASNRNLNDEFDSDGLPGTLSNNEDHSRVYDWYYGTINLSAANLISDMDEELPRTA